MGRAAFEKGCQSLVAAGTIQCQQMFARRKRRIQLDRTIAFHDGFPGTRKDCATTTAASGGGLNNRCAQASVEILNEFPGPSVRHAQGPSCSRD